VEEEKNKGLGTIDPSCSSPCLLSGSTCLVLFTVPLSNDFLPVHHLSIDAHCLMAQLQEKCWSSPDMCSGWAQSPQPFSPILWICHNINTGNLGRAVTACPFAKESNRDL